MKNKHMKNGKKVMKNIRFEELTHQQKCQIYNLTISGQYYSKEIREKFHITPKTHQRIINGIKDFLYTGTPNNL